MPPSLKVLERVGSAAAGTGNLPELLFAGLLLSRTGAPPPPEAGPDFPLPAFAAVKRLFPLQAKVRAAIQQQRFLSFCEKRKELEEAINGAGLDAVFPPGELAPPENTGFAQALEAYKRTQEVLSDPQSTEADLDDALESLAGLRAWTSELWMIRADLEREKAARGCVLEAGLLDEAVGQIRHFLETDPIPALQEPPYQELQGRSDARLSTARTLKERLDRELAEKEEELDRLGRADWKQDQQEKQRVFSTAVEDLDTRRKRLLKAVSEVPLARDLQKHNHDYEPFREVLGRGLFDEALRRRTPLDALKARIDAQLAARPDQDWISTKTGANKRICDENAAWANTENINRNLTAQKAREAVAAEEKGDAAFSASRFSAAEGHYGTYLGLFSMVDRLKCKQGMAQRGRQRQTAMEEAFKGKLRAFDSSDPECLWSKGTRKRVTVALEHLRGLLEKARKETIQCEKGKCPHVSDAKCPALTATPLFAREALAEMRKAYDALRHRHLFYLFTLRYFFRKAK